MELKLNNKQHNYPFNYLINQELLNNHDELSVNIPETLKVEGNLNKNDEKISIKLNLIGKVTYPCSRCLEPIEVDANFDLDESFESEALIIDLDEFVLDCLYINEPAQILCKEDCKGLCPQCGQNLNLGSCSCQDEEEIDPRLEKLRDLL